jgi:mitochondrial fission protein ELM1
LTAHGIGMSEVSYLRPPVIWLLTDNKPGHRNQLKGLGERLHTLADARLVWVEQKKHPAPLWRALLGLAAPSPYPAPNIIIAAGARTHRLLLSLRRKQKVMTVVLMRPNFPAHWIDAAIIPAHDRPAERAGTLITQGVLNAATPLARITSEDRGLILLGGPSRHFLWDDEIIYEQISGLSEQYPDWVWYLTSSRRTPDSLIRRILKSNLPNIQFHHHDDTAPDWLVETMSKVRVVWVSPDSVSMVYESLTASIPTGLLELEPVSNSRVAQGIIELERNGQVAPWSDRMALLKADPGQIEPLWEADRAARWLLQRWQQNLS